MSRRFLIENLGCKANAYDAHVIHQDLVANGWSPTQDATEADVVVVNSCTVTDQADRASRRAAKRWARRAPGARVVITGCGAEVAPDRMAAVPGVDLVVGNRRKRSIAAILVSPEGSSDVGAARTDRARHDPTRAWPEAESVFAAPLAEGVRTRAFLKVQEGCDAFCTFCIIPFARGPARSLRPGSVVRQVRELVAHGTREVVLSGTALDAYAADLASPGGLEDLARLLLEETSLERLRLGSLEPPAITPGLLGLMEREPRLCPHLHVSLQSPHSGILRRMGRRYDADAVATALRSIAAASVRIERDRGVPGGIFVGMDVIAGFPGEDEVTFSWTRDRLSALPWTRLHVFPYSERKGTGATRMGQPVPLADRRQRVRELMALSSDRLTARLESMVTAGQSVDILLEDSSGSDWVVGHTTNYVKVRAPRDERTRTPNSYARVSPERVTFTQARGEALLEGRLV